MSNTFKPGDKVPKSGIYKVHHDKKHAQDHEVTCVYGKKFPPCKDCESGVRFELVKTAQLIESNEHFKKSWGSECRSYSSRVEGDLSEEIVLTSSH